MARRHIATHFFICVAVLSSFLPKTSSVLLEGDVNGDKKVNILDLQMMVTNMLAVTDDSQVPFEISILDLQKTLDQTGESEQPIPIGNISYVCEVTFSSSSDYPVIQKSALHCVLTPSPAQIRLARACASFAHAPITTRTERYVYRLTPNAPPFCG